jgi:hypothetical protein
LSSIEETEQTGTERGTVLIFCPDVMFASRIQNLARHAGVRSQMVRPGSPVRSGDLLVASFRSGTGWNEAIREAAASGIPTIAFGPHVDAESRRAAKAAGAFRAVNNGNLEKALLPVLQDMAAGRGIGGTLAALPDADDSDTAGHDH